MPNKPAQLLRTALPLAVGAILFALGTWALFHLLKSVSLTDILAHVRATPLSVLALSLTATAAGYAALLFYDWFALQYIGKTLTAGVIALGGFLGYAFGNTIGVSVISGGAVRYRIYSAVGLNAFEVAAVSGYIAVALGIGMTLTGLGALTLHPGAIVTLLPWSEHTIRLTSGLAVVISVAVILWASIGQQRLRLWRIDIRMPRPSHLGGQFVVTLIDIAAASFALWILLPAGKPDFATFLAVYAAATMVGIVSHVPGGIGVFETVVIATLPAEVPVADAAAALLLFRAIYYIVPFALGFVLLALNEVRLVSKTGARLSKRIPNQIQPVLATMHGVSPSLVAVVVFGFGVYLLMVTMIPSVRTDAIADGDLIGALLLEGGTLSSAIAGAALLILSNGLARRVSSAWWLTMIVLCGAAFAALLSDLDLRGAILLIAGAAILLPFRKAFDRPGRLTQGVFGPRWSVTVVGVGCAAAALFFFVHKEVPYSNDLWTTFSANTATPRALRAGVAVTAILFLFGFYLLTHPTRGRPAVASDVNSLAQAAMIVRNSDNPQAWLSQTGDKQFLFSESGKSFIMYGVRGRSWIALGNPVGQTEEFHNLCWRFSEHAVSANFRPVFYEVSARHLQMWIGLGFTVNKIGEEAVVPLEDFSLTGSKFKTMRAAMNKRQREGYAVEILSPPYDAALMGHLQHISDSWLAGKTGQEKRFSVGSFDPDYLNLFPLAVCRKEGAIVAFANILVADNERKIAVDLMRYLPEEASGLIEYMFLQLIQHFKEAGAREFSLGAAPLAGLSEQSVARSFNRFGRLLYRHGGPFYNFEGLRAFKQKFQPDWRPCYLALPPSASPLIALTDTALLIAGSSRGLIAK